MDLSWHTLNSGLMVKILHHSEKQGFDYPRLSKEFQAHLLKPAEAEPSFRKVSLPLQNYTCFSHSPLGQRVLATNQLPLTGPGLRPTVRSTSTCTPSAI